MASLESELKRFINLLTPVPSQHVGFWLGSAISYFHPSSCASVEQIKRAYVLGPLHDLARTTDRLNSRTRLEVVTLLEKMLSPDDPLSREVSRLPFEQFMNSLDASCHQAALDVIACACQGAKYRSATVAANDIHRLFVSEALDLLHQRVCGEVTVFTTNYDTFLEESLQTLKVEARSTESSPHAIEARLPAGTLRIVKVHGCLTKPDALVYASDHWTDLLLADSWSAQLKRPHALLVAGYGFSDPHLRPLFAEWLPLMAPFVVLKKTSAGSERVSSDISAASQLRSEFLATLQDKQVIRVCDFESDSCRIGDQDQTSHKELAYQHLSDWQLVTAVSNIVDACGRGDASDLLRCCLDEQAFDETTTPQLIAKYLLQLGHQNEYSRAVQESTRLRRLYPAAQSVTLITTGYESFARTVTDVTLPQALEAYKAIQEGAALQSSDEPAAHDAASAFFTHRALHFWTKALQYQLAPQNLAVLEGARSHPILASIVAADPLQRARQLEGDLRRASTVARERKNLYGFAELEDLRAQVLIAAAGVETDPGGRSSDAKEAWTVARRVRDVYFSLDQLNSVILADRTFGWACLARHAAEPEGSWLAEAVRAMSNGFRRSLVCTDASLQWKLGANLIRLILPNIPRTSPDQPYPIVTACEVLCNDGIDASLEAKLSVWSYLESIHPDRTDDLIKLLHDYDMLRYPVFLA